MNDVNGRLSALSLQQRALLERRLVERRAAVKATASHGQPKTDTPVGPQPLSHAQETLWFFDKLVPDSPLYNIPQAFRLRGPLDLAALEKSFRTVLERHAALRTRFIEVNERPMALVENPTLDWSLLDVRARNPMVREAEVTRLLQEQATRPFDLGKDPLLRVTVVALSDQEHLLIVVVHHIVSDNWSLGILYREVNACYEAFTRGEQPALPELGRQFPELAASLRREADAARDTPALRYWKEELTDAPAHLEFPLAGPRPARQSYRGSRRPVHLSAQLRDQISLVGQREGASLYMTLLAGFAALLHRYSRQEQILIGSPLGLRDSAEAEKLIGLFVNTLPLRADLSGHPTFNELLRRIREKALGAYGRAKIPFDVLVEELKVARDPSRHPLYQVVFQVVNEATARFELPGIEVKVVSMETGTAKFDLTFTLVESPRGLDGDIEFNSDLFQAETVDRLIGHFRVLLESIASAPSEKISALRLLPPDEEHRLLVEWNITSTPYPRERAIHQLFEEQVQRAPDAVALSFEGRTLTYGELNIRANRLARFLQAQGVARGSFVGICLERSLDLIVALIGILKAGAAYVPLDASFPRERLAWMAADAAPSAVLTSTSLKASLPSETRILCLDEISGALEQEESANLDSAPEAADPAYVIYTSGSTGKPKGAVIPHRAVVRLVRDTNYATFGVEEVFLLFAPISFDASTLEIWGPLLNGGRLVIFPPAFDSLQQLQKVLLQERVSTLWLTAGLFHHLVDHDIQALQHVRQLLAGGDVLSVPHVRRVIRELSACQLINGYGPTENTTFTCCFRVPRDWEGTTSVPIGQPISNTSVYILDSHFQPVPIGVPGELFTGGDGLALRYLNSEALTSEKFVASPWDGARLYRTGDLARYRSDGVIEFLGRMDSQVKVRGFRIELGEVEAALRGSRLVREGVVVTKADASGSNFLVAYVVLQEAGDVAQLRNSMTAQLPGHMVPSQFVVLNTLPITANGKVDRAALPAPDEALNSQRAKEIPQNDAESKILQIWADVLQVSGLGVTDSFFEVGGHSLLATRIISRINEAFQADLSLATLFEFPTVRGLAARVAKVEHAGTARIQRRVRTPMGNGAGPKTETATGIKTDPLLPTPL